MSYTPGSLVHKDRSDGLRIEIRDNGELRSLYFGDGQLQSRMYLSRPWELTLPYTRYMAGAVLLFPEPRRILLIGLGAGSLAHFFLHHFPECRVTCVESSQKIIALAKGFFRLPEMERIEVKCRDGLEYVLEVNDRYDLLLVDAFDEEGMAASIYEAAFFERCASLLSKDGIMTCNLWSSNRSRLKYLQEVLASHFANVWHLPVPERGNVVAWASQMDQPWVRLPTKVKRVTTLSRRYSLDLQEIITAAKSNNLNLAQRLFLAFR